MFDTVECPYCEHENDMSDGLTDLPSDNKFDHECESCEREFEVEVEFYPSYSGLEIINVDCQICKTTTRDPAKKGSIFPWPAFLTQEIVCRTCFVEGHRKEYEMKSKDGDANV